MKLTNKEIQDIEYTLKKMKVSELGDKIFAFIRSNADSKFSSMSGEDLQKLGKKDRLEMALEILGVEGGNKLIDIAYQALSKKMSLKEYPEDDVKKVCDEFLDNFFQESLNERKLCNTTWYQFLRYITPYEFDILKTTNDDVQDKFFISFDLIDVFTRDRAFLFYNHENLIISQGKETHTQMLAKAVDELAEKVRTLRLNNPAPLKEVDPNLPNTDPNKYVGTEKAPQLNQRLDEKELEQLNVMQYIFGHIIEDIAFIDQFYMFGNNDDINKCCQMLKENGIRKVYNMPEKSQMPNTPPYFIVRLAKKCKNFNHIATRLR